MSKSKLVLLRHGESVWNLENRFTGWKNVALSENGEKEARAAGKLLKENGFVFDMAYTSVLKRAVTTLWRALEVMDDCHLPVRKAWQLNERHYGALQGLNKEETRQKHGEEQVHIWRRSFDIAPPELEENDPRYQEQVKWFAPISKDKVPRSESLKLTIERVLPYWESVLVPKIREGKKLLIVAHGNSLRALVKHLADISDEEISSLNIPTGKPLVIELNEQLKQEKQFYL